MYFICWRQSTKSHDAQRSALLTHLAQYLPSHAKIRQCFHSPEGQYFTVMHITEDFLHYICSNRCFLALGLQEQAAVINNQVTLLFLYGSIAAKTPLALGLPSRIKFKVQASSNAELLQVPYTSLANNTDTCLHNVSSLSILPLKHKNVIEDWQWLKILPQESSWTPMKQDAFSPELCRLLVLSTSLSHLAGQHYLNSLGYYWNNFRQYFMLWLAAG